MDKKSKNTLIISIIALALVLIGVTYAYFSARIAGLESASTISLTAGRMGIHYTEGDEDVTFSNIYPREEAWATKTFDLTGYNSTDLEMYYNLGLNVITNTFADGYLRYDLTLLEYTDGIAIETATDNPISGTGKIKFGRGSFPQSNEGNTHYYELKIYFKDNGLDQNDSQQAVFNAKVYIEEARNEPDGWSTASAGSLMAAIKSNHSTLSTLGTIPGVDPSSCDPITKTVYDFCDSENDCEVSYYDTQEDVYSGLGGYQDYYSEIYSDLDDKWIWYQDYTTAYYVLEATSSQITYTNNSLLLEKESDLFLSTEDDYGTSYYFRGAIDNNYLVFAGMCWRIVRITGNGDIKLTLYNYNPTNAANPCASNLDGSTKAFARLTANNANSYSSKFNTNYNRNTYIGFMYSNNPDSSDYNVAHANDVDSTILTNLKSWYDRVFTSSQKEQLADTIWCNDKRVESNTVLNPRNLSGVVGSGLGTDTSYYKAAIRILPQADAEPSLKCGDSKSDNKISKFTSSTATDGGYGNGKLNGYKIGLLTTDELAFAGANVDGGNPDYYLYKNANIAFWTLSPFVFTSGLGGIATVWYGGAFGSIDSGNLTYNGAIRPAIALKSDTTISGGVGTQANPFVVN